MIGVNQDAGIYRARVFPLSKCRAIEGIKEKIMRCSKDSVSTTDFI
jgi:hypothetical protein